MIKEHLKANKSSIKERNESFGGFVLRALKYEVSKSKKIKTQFISQNNPTLSNFAKLIPRDI